MSVNQSNIPFQTAIKRVEAFSPEDQDLLIVLIKNRRIEKRRIKITRNAAQTLGAFKAGEAKRGTLAELKANLLSQE